MVDTILAEILAARMKLSACGSSIIIKGFLKNGLIDAVVKQMHTMCAQGHAVPPFAVAQLLLVASDADRCEEAFNIVKESPDLGLSADAIAVVLEDCVERSQPVFARRVENASKEAGLPLVPKSYEFLLKLCCASGDVHALASSMTC